MRHPFALASLTGLVLLMAALLAGCAARSAVIAAPEQEATKPGPSQGPGTAAEGWWYVRFGLHWPAGAEPAWNRDLLLADQVVRPALSQHREAISLWRFHRRAARDGAGHRFSLIFRASPASAASIYDQIRTNATLARLQRRGMVESVGFDDLSRIERPGVADTSDRAEIRCRGRRDCKSLPRAVGAACSRDGAALTSVVIAVANRQHQLDVLRRMPPQLRDLPGVDLGQLKLPNQLRQYRGGWAGVSVASRLSTCNSVALRAALLASAGSSPTFKVKARRAACFAQGERILKQAEQEGEGYSKFLR